jgi:hypothetical protein
MTTNGHPRPTPAQWAKARLHVSRYDDGPQPIFHLQKRAKVRGHILEQSVWITLSQLEAMARDCRKP